MTPLSPVLIRKELNIDFLKISNLNLLDFLLILLLNTFLYGISGIMALH